SRIKALVIEGGKPRQRLEEEEGGDDWKNGGNLKSKMIEELSVNDVGYLTFKLSWNGWQRRTLTKKSMDAVRTNFIERRKVISSKNKATPLFAVKREELNNVYDDVRALVCNSRARRIIDSICQPCTPARARMLGILLKHLLNVLVRGLNHRNEGVMKMINGCNCTFRWRA
nr:hypothetical protein [Tanacetum cinerariifolium]